EGVRSTDHRPGRGNRTGLAQEVSTEGPDGPGLLRQADEGIGLKRAVVGMTPTGKRLEADDLIAPEIHKRLVVKGELPIGDCIWDHCRELALARLDPFERSADLRSMSLASEWVTLFSR